MHHKAFGSHAPSEPVSGAHNAPQTPSSFRWWAQEEKGREGKVREETPHFWKREHRQCSPAIFFDTCVTCQVLGGERDFGV